MKIFSCFACLFGKSKYERVEKYVRPKNIQEEDFKLAPKQEKLKKDCVQEDIVRKFFINRQRRNSQDLAQKELIKRHFKRQKRNLDICSASLDILPHEDNLAKNKNNEMQFK